ncbi:MAG TPA: MATE family efflux transporter [Candidatus Acidoferrales bacterium]|nr:MATE family efflux transporter [Candidatus Acidoferrales bacterium]
MAVSAARRPGVNIFDTSRPLWQWFAIFLVPVMIANILQSASQTFSAIFLGRMIGVNALAAVSAVFPIIFLLFAFLIGLASGSSVLIGQAFGAKDEHRVKKIAGTMLGATLALGIIVAIIGFLVSPHLLAALRTPGNIIAQADAYARVIFLVMPIFFPYLAYTTFMRGTGDSQTPLYSLIVSTVLTILLTPAFIRGWFGLPELGVVSPAVAGVIANGTALLALVLYLRHLRHPLQFDAEMARDMLIDWHILWQVVRIGVPTGVQVIMVSLAEIAVISFVNRFGSSATAAYGAVNQVVNYVQFPAISIGITASIFGAQCIGARREDMLGKVVRSAVAMNYIIGGVLIGTCYLFAWDILGWFITDPGTLHIAHTLIMIVLWSYLLFGNSAVISGVVRGSGDVIVPMLNGIFSIWGVEVPSAYILMHVFGLNGVWMGYPISYIVVLSLQYSYYHFFWRKRVHKRIV